MTRRERIAELWASRRYTAEEIAALVGIEPRNVFEHLAALRRVGDPRAHRRPQGIRQATNSAA
jgi:DNA-binding CsgD family transcriptional regulator